MATAEKQGRNRGQSPAALKSRNRYAAKVGNKTTQTNKALHILTKKSAKTTNSKCPRASRQTEKSAKRRRAGAGNPAGETIFFLFSVYRIKGDLFSRLGL